MQVVVQSQDAALPAVFGQYPGRQAESAVKHSALLASPVTHNASEIANKYLPRPSERGVSSLADHTTVN
jgi:hypothetical protein